MVYRVLILFIATLATTAFVVTPVAWSQNPYGGSRQNSRRQQRQIPTFGVGSSQSQQTGTYAGSPSPFRTGLQSAQTYPPAPRVRRPVISPYLNLNRPEGIVGGVPNYYSLVRPRVQAQQRYQAGVDNLHRIQDENALRQQELFDRQQQDFDILNRRLDEQNQSRGGRGSAARQTRYGALQLRSTGHGHSFGVR